MSAFCGAVALAGSNLALAHPESVPALVNRYATVAAHEDQLEISVARLYGQIPAADLRAATDTDGNGVLSEAELALLQRRFGLEAETWLQVSHNGSPVSAKPTVHVDIGGQARTGRLPLVVEARLPLPAAGLEHNVELTLGAPPPWHGETEVMAALGTGWDLIASQGPGGPKAFLHKLAADANGHVAFVLRRQASSGPGRPRGIALGAALAGVLGVALWLWSRRR